MKTLFAIPLAAVLSLGLGADAMAAHSMHHVYHKHYKGMHKGARYGHRQACIGRSSGTAHRSCGTHSGGPSGGLH